VIRRDTIPSSFECLVHRDLLLISGGGTAADETGNGQNETDLQRRVRSNCRGDLPGQGDEFWRGMETPAKITLMDGDLADNVSQPASESATLDSERSPRNQFLVPKPSVGALQWMKSASPGLGRRVLLSWCKCLCDLIAECELVPDMATRVPSIMS